MADSRRRLSLVPVVLIGLGLLTALLGLASGRLWRTDDVVVASATPAGPGKYQVSDPGVLSLVSPDVTVRASAAADETVTLAIGREADVAGWVADDGFSRITGLADWTTLTTMTVAPEAGGGTGSDPVPLADSDMWVARASGEGSATLRWADRPGRWSLIAATSGENAPTVELSWPRTATTPLLWPLVGIGSALALLGGALALLHPQRSKPVPVSTDAIPIVTGVAPGDGLAPAEGIVPAVPRRVEPPVVVDETAIYRAPVAGVNAEVEPYLAPVAVGVVAEVEPYRAPVVPEAATEPEPTPVAPEAATEPEPTPVVEPAPVVEPTPVATEPEPTPAAPPAGVEPMTATAAIRLSRRAMRAATEAGGIPIVEAPAADTSTMPVLSRRQRRDLIAEAERTGNTEALAALTGVIPTRPESEARP